MQKYAAWVFTVLAWAIGSTASALETFISFPEGPPVVGEEVAVEVLVFENGKRVPGRAPELLPKVGRIAAHRGEVRPGSWGFRYQAPAEPQAVGLEIRVEGDLFKHTIPVSGELPPSLDSGPIRTGRAGQAKPIYFELSMPTEGSAATLQVGSPEGEVVEIAPRDGGLNVAWRPGPGPFARAIPLGFRDGRQPGAAPAWTVVYLRSYPKIPIRTEPGTRVELKVGSRSYGPFIADKTGLAAANIEVRPGEDVAEVTLSDSLGNTQRTSLNLGGDPSPGIVAIAEGVGANGAKQAVIHVFAIRPDGRAWRGEAPECQTSLGQSLRSVTAGAGAWRYFLPPVPEGAFFDIRVDCMIGARARTSIRVPVEPAPASLLNLRAYPAEMAAELPVTQVEAYLENASGERVPADGILITADLGEITILDDETGPAAVRAIYEGEAAVAAGQDTLRAVWSLPPGEGGVWSLQGAAECETDTSHCLLHARALDRLGRPLEGVEVQFEAGGESIRGTTNSAGWVSTTVKRSRDRVPFVCVIYSGIIERELVLFPGEKVGPEVDAADLVQTFDVSIRSGQVRNVFLNAEPNPMYAGKDVNARVRLKLVDGEGNPVQDETLEIRATEGVLTQPRIRGGVYESTWAPRPGMAHGTVEITATSRSGLFVDTATELEVSPQPVRTGLSMEGGWIWGPDEISNLWIGGALDRKAPGTERLIYGRLDIGAYQVTSSSVDVHTGNEVRVELDLLPIGLGSLIRQERGRFSTWLGGSIRLVPYRLRLDFGDQSTLDHRALAPPGASLYAGTGYRLLSSELYLQLSYELVSLPGKEVGFSGPVGGSSVRSGYRVLF